jgi:hypothetical protein
MHGCEIDQMSNTRCSEWSQVNLDQFYLFIHCKELEHYKAIVYYVVFKDMHEKKLGVFIWT